MYSKLPAELKSLRNWCLWQYEDIGAIKSTKVPYSSNGKHADVNRPETWCSFDEAVAASSNYSGIGFVFNGSGYSFIDLDESLDQATLNRQIKIHSEFDSYSEVSPGGKGLHIIVKGSVPSGRRRSSIEIYSSQRYATMTGQVYNNKPIKECQSLLTQLWEQMGSGAPATLLYKGDEKELENDETIIKRAGSAVNGDKFLQLFKGDRQSLYPSQSEADFALINIIAFYTQNRIQIERIFRNSALGSRPKAKRKDYLNWMVNKSFDRMLPPIDFDGFKIALEQKLAPKPVAQIPAITASKAPLSLPPGLMGELAQFIYAAAPRQVQEVALAGAIGLMAGITGRAYNISGTGLNQYVLLIAQTGIGKESLSSGIDRLMSAIAMQVPTSKAFIGPSEIASGQALVKYLGKTSQCFVSILGEFGLRLQSMSSQHANSAEISLRRMLLDLYNKSGHGQTFRASIYADAEKNTNATESPAFSILGESTPERFYGALNEEMISEGLLPRFMLIEYTGIRPSFNKGHGAVIPHFSLVDKLASLAAYSELQMHGKKVVNIEQSPEAQKITDAFDEYATDQINGTNKDIIRQLWNRAHMKVLKLSGLIAVGVNMTEPLVLPEYVLWAMDMVQADIRALTHKFEAGEIGANTNEIRQEIELARIIKEYFVKDWETISKYTSNEKLYKAKIIPYQYMSSRVLKLAPYKNDLKTGATNALKRTIQIMIDSDKLREIGKPELSSKYGTTMRAFVVSDLSMLN